MNGLLGSALALVVALGVWGCGKKAAPGTPQPAPAAASDAPAAQPPAQIQPAQPTVQSTAQPDGQANLAEVNRILIRWMVRNKRRPASFEDFAATAGAPIPPPPAGMKYVIGPKVKIELVNQ
jgi:hypothetical protein